MKKIFMCWKRFLKAIIKKPHGERLFFLPVIMLQLFISANNSIFAQYEYNNQFNIPSAQVWSFLRYGNTPQYLYNGTVRQDIPVYTYQDPDFTIPVSLSYASNGYMANVQASEVGLGWFINVGGSIVRQVREIPDENDWGTCDEFRYGYYSYHMLPSPPNAGGTIWERGESHYKHMDIVDANAQWRSFLFSHFFQDPTKGYGFYNYDLEKNVAAETLPDIFTFNFMGHNGKFMMGPQQKVYVYATNEPHGEYTIDLTNLRKSDNQNNSSKIVIKTADGYSYIFGGADNFYNIDSTVSDEQELIDWGNGSTCFIGYDTQYHWPLTRIIAPNGRTVTFEYELYSSANIKFEGSSGYSGIGILDGNGTIIGDGQYYHGYYCPIHRSTNVCCIKSIHVNNDKKIEFTYNQNRKKEKGYARIQGLIELSTPPRLEKISIQSNNVVYKEAVLTHVYAPSTGNEVMFLKSVDITGDGKYQMEYYNVNTGTDAGTVKPFPYHGTCGVDHWGYYNNKNEYNYPFFPCFIYTESQFVEYHQPDSTGAILGMLKKITYPTKGYSLFEYEKQKYCWSAENNLSNPFFPLKTSVPTRIGGGLRLKKITDYASTNSYSSRTYEYGDGFIRFFPKYSIEYNYAFTVHGRNLYHTRLPDPISLYETVLPVYRNLIVDDEMYQIDIRTHRIGSILPNLFLYDQATHFYHTVKEIYSDNSFCVNEYSFYEEEDQQNNYKYYELGSNGEWPYPDTNCECTWTSASSPCAVSSCIHKLHRKYTSLAIFDGKLICKTL